MSKKTWDSRFTPSYTPMEMLDMGVMLDCHYFNKVKGVPAKYRNHPKVNQPKDTPDASKNHYGVKSRQSLKEWEDKGWIYKEDAAGWIEWFIKYFEGRRIPDEDDRQIKRWRSFVARHQAQVDAKCKKSDKSCNTKQRQGLLNWAWNSDTQFTEKQQVTNLKRILKETGLNSEEVSNESLPPSTKW